MLGANRFVSSTSVLLLSALGSLAACGGGEDNDRVNSDVVMRDSAGISIAENFGRAESIPTYAEVGEPSLTIGSVDGEEAYSFTRIVDVRELRDGTIVVADAGTGELKVFDQAGAHLGTLGGSGDGPGEFGFMGGITGIAGDTIWVLDRRAQRMTAFAAWGELLETRTFGSEYWQALNQAFLLPDGNWIGVSHWYATRDGMMPEKDLGLTRDTIVVRRLDPGGALLDTIAVVPNQESVEEISRSGNMVGIRRSFRPFGKNTFVAVSGTDLVIGSNDRFEFSVRELTEGSKTLVRALELQKKVEGDDRDRLFESYMKRGRGDEEKRRASLEELFDIAPLPEMRPAYTAIVRDADGKIWVREHRLNPERIATWYVFRPSGELVGTVRVPPGLVVYEVGRDYVLGSLKDEFDVPSVHRYTLTRSDAEETDGSE